MDTKGTYYIIILTFLVQAGLITLQGYWLFLNYQLEEKAFQEQLQSALGGLYERIDIGDKLHNELLNLSQTDWKDKPKGNWSLLSKLKEELLLKNIDTTFNFRLYRMEGPIFAYKQIGKTPPAKLSEMLYSTNIAKNTIDYYFFDVCRNCNLCLAIDLEKINWWFFFRKMIAWVMICLILTLLQVGILIYVFRVIYKQRKLADWKNDFINHITHELNTPIFSISLGLKHLKKQIPNQKNIEVKQLLEVLEEENARLKSNVKRALDLTRLETNTLPLQKENLNLNELIDQVLRLFTVQRAGENVRLNVENNREVFHLMADKDMLFNVFYNLIDNAIKYNQSEIKEVQIQIKPIENDFLEISITDNGIGIAKSEQKFIFQKYYRANKADKKIKGTGLGLSYAKLVIEAHNGKIAVKSRPSGGSAFSIILPKNKR